VCNTWDYWVFQLSPLSGILKNTMFWKLEVSVLRIFTVHFPVPKSSGACWAVRPTEWSIWDVTTRNENVAEKNPLYYQLVVHTSVGGTPLLCHNTLTLNMTTMADAAQFILHRQVAPHFHSDLCIDCGDLLSVVSFIPWSLSIHKWPDVLPHEKVWRRQVRHVCLSCTSAAMRLNHL
jgi:hypothetical protein